MSSSSSSPNRNGLVVMGYEVDFPYPQPYQAQRALISNSMVAFAKSSNALLESPTGTGKTLSLLASSLAYQTHLKNESVEIPSTLDTTSPYFSKGMQSPVREFDSDEDYSTNTYPRIYYTSRTHSQLKQVVSELKKLKNYHPNLAILGSRREFCINENVKGMPDLDKTCRNKAGDPSFCSYTKNSKSVPRDFHPGGEYEKFDIEELKDYCREKNMCPYFLSRAMLRSADLVLCPYNYIIDERIRRQMKIDISKTIILFDEGHNIEQICRDAASVSISIKDAEYLSSQLHSLVDPDLKVVGPELEKSMKNILVFIDRLLDWLKKNDEEKPWEKIKDNKSDYYQCNDIELIMSGWKLTKSKWCLYSEDMKAIIKVNEKEHMGVEAFIQDRVASILSNLDICFGLFFKNKACDDYEIILTNFKDDLTMKLLCMSPGVVFRRIDKQTHSIILTSGTLSPLEQYESELCTNFQQRLSAKHVIDPQQVCSMIVTSIDRVVMTSANKVLSSDASKQVYKMLGKIVLTIVKNVPDGVLLFFPSSSILNRCIEAWEKDDEMIAKYINDVKPVFIDGGGKNFKSKWKFFKKSRDPLKEYTSSVNQGKGGLLIGVIRGKLSEGIDFADRHARSVVLFGVPYPNYFSPEVALKRVYNDKHALKEGMPPNPDVFNTCNGNEWYSTQAYRALAQAVGRCIRNIKDYGSIVLIDHRFPQDKSKFPKWLQRSLIGSDVQSLEEIERRLKNFYPKMEERFPDSVSRQSEINLSERMIVTHSECLSKIAKVQSMDKKGAFNTKSKVLLSMFDSNENIDQLTFERIRPGDCVMMDGGELGKHVWSEEDGMGYKPIICKKCNEVVGYHVYSTTQEPDKFPNMRADMFNIDQCNITQHQLSDKMSSYVLRPRNMQMVEGENGQRLLSFL